MLYCKCGLPPEYCEVGAGQKANDLDECKKWLAENHPEEHHALYVQGKEVNDEETKEEGKKKKKKVKFVEVADKRIRVIILKRGGKKINSQILGLENYGINLVDCARLLSKRFACGAACTKIDFKEVTDHDGISVQGNVREGFEDFCGSDLAQYGIDVTLISFEDGGNKKTRTR